MTQVDITKLQRLVKEVRDAVKCVSITGGTTDLTNVENGINTIIGHVDDIETLLNSILTAVTSVNNAYTPTILSTTSAGSIPAGVQSYSIAKIAGNQDWTFGGQTIPADVELAQSGNGGVIDGPIAYDPGGGTLLVMYLS